jgi:pimeloyl-ACP methyl ester carboxylesterase
MQHPDYQEISRKFRHTPEWNDAVPLVLEGAGVDIFNLSFHSQRGDYLLGHDGYQCTDHGLRFPGERTIHSPEDNRIGQNLRFRYPLVREALSAGTARRHDRAVIVLHGLNERSFSKYIPWAYHLWKGCNAPVLLFPMTFHINRVSPQWAREQQANLEARKAIPGNENVHRFNAVISHRLGTHPERFIWGAIQSFWDIVDLVRQIRDGRHAHVDPDAEIDLLGFSAGGYVALVLMLENPEGLFSHSRAVLFASGSMVRDVNLSSHLIVDQAAEIALMNLYVKHRKKLSGPRLLHWMEAHREGQWFNCFCGLMPDRARLDPRLRALAPRLLGIANSNDSVFPTGAIHNTLQGVHRDIPIRVEELDLGIHENPFAIPAYDWRDRAVITEFLSVPDYGCSFERFIALLCSHFSR